MSAQRRSEGAASCAHQGAPKGRRRVIGGWGSWRGSALGEEHLGPLGQGAATRRAGATQEVEGRGRTLLAERALAGPWGGRTAERAACTIKGTGPGRGRAFQTAVAVRLQVERGARRRRPALRGQRAVGEQSRGALGASERGVCAVAGRLPGGPAAAEGLRDRAGAVPGQLGRVRGNDEVKGDMTGLGGGKKVIKNQPRGV